MVERLAHVFMEFVLNLQKKTTQNQHVILVEQDRKSNIKKDDGLKGKTLSVFTWSDYVDIELQESQLISSNMLLVIFRVLLVFPKLHVQ